MTPKFDTFYQTFVENYNKQELANLFANKLGELPKSKIKNVNDWMEKEVVYLIRQAQIGRIDRSLWNRSHPPIYRQDYPKYKEEFDTAAEIIQDLVISSIEKSSENTKGGY